ncbi:S8 family serine peptidase [Sporosarcina sp. E16_3]|uniref:S8 family peptidase n=1 Tax=Sporosarcina sp. E16_3 TaxID=2789293 RepID=UPI001A939EAE|nr:S8 family serine peptidase [Sporosarcina sp. E16_3]MBO0602564.1 S8 family serine peptidase [Sporosarcina sp. E16_3]
MKNTLSIIGLFFILGISFVTPASNEVFASSKENNRLLVKFVSEDGSEFIESISKEEFELLNGVEVLQPDFIRYAAIEKANAPSVSWGKERIGAKKIAEKLVPGKGSVIIAVIDTGVDYTHPLLKDRIVAGYDVIKNTSDPVDVHFHGTHVAGIIADSTPANVKIMPIRAMNEKGEGYDSDISTAIRFAVDNGADIINLSFVGEDYSQYLADALHYAISNNVLVVVVAGNNGADTANYFPASEKSIIVVSATDQNDNSASFSNTGEAIDLSAPGVGIVSSLPGNRYGSLSGTSMAAPFVSSIAAMIKLNDPTRSIKDIERLLKKYVDDRGAVGWDPIFGEGIVNVASYDEPRSASADVAGMDFSDFISLPSVRNVPLTKEWHIEFTQQLSTKDVIDVHVFRGSDAVPIRLRSNIENKEIIATPIFPYAASTSYKLVIRVKNGKSYQMDFHTGD